MAGRKSDFTLTKLDDLFTTQAQRDEEQLSKIRDIPLELIDDFPDHPFKVRDNEDMMQLVESVKERGVITPATVRQKEDGRYELVSGHRRKRACELAGFETLRSEIVDLNRDEATILMVESNFQRSEILPSEKAFAYKMRLETETGIYEMKELLYGKYIVRETKAPEGFLLDKGEYSVFIEKDETTYSVENKAGVGFINEAMRGTLKIVKTSSDGKVKGFAFRVTGANGYDMTFETDKNGEIVIDGLRIGEYTVSEVANNASAAYITPADQNVTIKLDETAVVKMHNELRDTPKTGDDTNMKLWYVLAGLSAVGIAVTSVVAHKKKKKEGNE